jgi:hypothetical protein
MFQTALNTTLFLPLRRRSISADCAMAMSNLDVSTYVVALDFHVKLFGRRPFSAYFPAIQDFYGRAIEAVPIEARVLCDTPLQAGEQLGAADTASNEPWSESTQPRRAPPH